MKLYEPRAFKQQFTVCQLFEAGPCEIVSKLVRHVLKIIDIILSFYKKQWSTKLIQKS